MMSWMASWSDAVVNLCRVDLASALEVSIVFWLGSRGVHLPLVRGNPVPRQWISAFGSQCVGHRRYTSPVTLEL